MNIKNIGLAVLALIIIVGGYMLFTKSSEGSYTKKEDSAPVATIMLYKESGFVTWKKVGDAEYQRVTVDELALPNNVYIKTVEGRGYVVLPDNSSIALSTSTEILINYEPKRVSIEQLLGTTYHRVEALVTGASYEVKTAGTLASVRGTKFSVSYDNKKKKTRVAVTSHKVDIAPLDDIKGQATTTPKTLEEGMLVTLIDKPEPTPQGVEQKREMVIQKMDTIPEEKKWLEENKKIDILIDKQRDGGDKRRMIKDLMKELKQETPEDSTKPQVIEKDRIQVIEKVIQKIEVRRTTSKVEDGAVVKPTEVVPTPSKTTDTVPVKQPVNTDTSVPVKVVATTTTIVPRLKTFSMTTDVLNAEDQKFIDTFYTAYEKYLAVDANGEVCTRIANETDVSIITNLEKIANNAGYVMPNKTELQALAKFIVTSCKDGSLKTNLQLLETQFDTAYPFTQ